MSYRRHDLVEGEIYHVYNRGVDKRIIFQDKQDFFQCLQMLDLFNQEDALGGIEKYKYPHNLEQRGKASLLVHILAYCLNQNHYHIILQQVAEKGISQFMQKIGTGYTMYFNQKYGRSGSLFQGKFKSVHVSTDEYFKGVSAYVNLNNHVHTKQRGKASLLPYRSSWWEYGGEKEPDAFHAICKTGMVLENFRNTKEYRDFAQDYVKTTMSMRQDKKGSDLADDKALFLE